LAGSTNGPKQAFLLRLHATIRFSPIDNRTY
jgi:hypothetical protein